MGHATAVRLVYLAEDVVEIYNLISPGVDPVLSIVGEIQRVCLYHISVVIRHGLVTLQKLSARKRNHEKEEVPEEIRRKQN